MNVRQKISSVYWDAVKALGPLVPTPQVLAGSITAGLGELIEAYVPGLDYAAWLSLLAGAVVAYAVGPEPSVPPGTTILGPPTVATIDLPGDPPPSQLEWDSPHLHFSADAPDVDGEWVGDDDDPRPSGLT